MSHNHDGELFLETLVTTIKSRCRSPQNALENMSTDFLSTFKHFIILFFSFFQAPSEPLSQDACSLGHHRQRLHRMRHPRILPPVRPRIHEQYHSGVFLLDTHLCYSLRSATFMCNSAARLSGPPMSVWM